jgi:beta-glucosidase
VIATRRVVLAGLAASALPAAAAQPRGWPKGFLWGTATAAHQIEGNNVGSDYWLLEHLPGTNFVEPSGDACDSWNRWQEDIALVKAMGLNAYRFSVEWARIEPEKAAFSNAALAHYRAICTACREAGIAPVVTFHHFSSPRWIAAIGGWENPETAQHFARYCARTAAALRGVVDTVCTMNEPNAQVTSFVMRGDRVFDGEAAIVARASRALGSDRFGSYFMGDSFRVRDVCLQAHGLARDAIKAALPGVRVGMTLALQDLVPGPGGEVLYQRIFDNARRPFYEAARADDFLGVQPYMRLRVGPTGYLPPPAGVMLNDSGQEASPDVPPAVVREAWTHAQVPILVSENGIEAENDALRVRHLTASVAALHGVVADGVPLLGYVHWSLMDNFEWRSGYRPRFGLHAVDRVTFARTAKPSAAVYRELVVAAGRIPPP